MKALLLLTALLALPCGIWLTPCSAGETPSVIFEDDFDSDSDGPAAMSASVFARMPTQTPAV